MFQAYKYALIYKKKIFLKRGKLIDKANFLGKLEERM